MGLHVLPRAALDLLLEPQSADEKPMTDRSLVPAEPIKPLQTAEEAAQWWAEFKSREIAIMDRQRDFTKYTDDGKISYRPNKSYCKKIATLFGIEVTTPECVREDLGEGEYGYRVRARAVAPNGRITEAWAGCSTTEKRFQNAYAKLRAYNDIIATAETRATNRSILNLIGTGVVTAEELVPQQSPRAIKARSRIFAIARELKLTDNSRHSLQRERLGVDSLTEANEQQLIEFGTYLNGLLDRQNEIEQNTLDAEESA